MLENIETSKFLNYLLKTKYEIAEESNPVIENHLKGLKINTIILDFTSQDFLSNLNNFLATNHLSNIEKDFLFCLLFTNEEILKKIKPKTSEFNLVRDLYGDSYKQNIKFINEYNLRGMPKLNINLPKKIVTRFPPEPSGYLHIGHAKAALWNQKLAENGDLIIRFDDTNPLKESKVFEDAILEDLKLLKITNFRLTKSSEYFGIIFDYAVQLIKDGKAYCDNTDVETMRIQRTDGIPSKNRNMCPEEAHRIFQEMNRGGCKEYCLRAKISYDNPNKAMRDPVIYRHVEVDHQSTGSKYKIYPTYDMTVPIMDSLEGVTLALRTNEYRDRNEQYNWFLENLQLENKPKIHDFSRLNFDNTVISKRQMKFYVENNYVTGWDDPRMSTLRGLVRLGMNMDCLREYIYSQGLSQKTAIVSWDKIWALNKKFIDMQSTRLSAVCSENFVTCFVVDSSFTGEAIDFDRCLITLNEKIDENADKIVAVPKYKKNLQLGNKDVVYSSEFIISQDDARILEVNEEFTLMNWGNAKILEKVVDNGIVKHLKLKLMLEGDFKQTKNKINWVSKTKSVFVKLFEFGYLQNREDTDDLAKKFNAGSKKSTWYFAEKAVLDVKLGDTVQFERIGFFYCDGDLNFNLIPFTKQKRTESDK